MKESDQFKGFSEYAHEKLLDLYEHHAHEVGSELQKTDPVKYGSYAATNCITYALNVLSHAFRNIGDVQSAEQVWTFGEHGTELARHLVVRHGWKGIYVNPDVGHPRDADSEHPYSHYLAVKTCQYYKIPLSYKVINYMVTSTQHEAFQKLNVHLGQTTANETDIAGLELVDFGFGVSRGGRHTWVYAKGMVYEVHWDQIGECLYEATPLRVFPWLSGAIVVPPEQASVLPASAALAYEG